MRRRLWRREQVTSLLSATRPGRWVELEARAIEYCITRLYTRCVELLCIAYCEKKRHVQFENLICCLI